MIFILEVLLWLGSQDLCLAMFREIHLPSLGKVEVKITHINIGMDKFFKLVWGIPRKMLTNKFDFLVVVVWEVINTIYKECIHTMDKECLQKDFPCWTELKQFVGIGFSKNEKTSLLFCFFFLIKEKFGL